MGYCTDYRGRLSCDVCGESGGVRKRHCPHGYCPAPAICPGCWAKPEVKRDFADYHVKADCKGHHERFKADMDKRAELLAAGRLIRGAAWGEDNGIVRVRFNGKGEEHDYRMTQETYHALELLEVTTLEDYQAIGTVVACK